MSIPYIPSPIGSLVTALTGGFQQGRQWRDSREDRAMAIEDRDTEKKRKESADALARLQVISVGIQNNQIPQSVLNTPEYMQLREKAGLFLPSTTTAPKNPGQAALDLVDPAAMARNMSGPPVEVTRATDAAAIATADATTLLERIKSGRLKNLTPEQQDDYLKFTPDPVVKAQIRAAFATANAQTATAEDVPGAIAHTQKKRDTESAQLDFTKSVYEGAGLRFENDAEFKAAAEEAAADILGMRMQRMAEKIREAATRGDSDVEIRQRALAVFSGANTAYNQQLQAWNTEKIKTLTDALAPWAGENPSKAALAQKAALEADFEARKPTREMITDELLMNSGLSREAYQFGMSRNMQGGGSTGGEQTTQQQGGSQVGGPFGASRSSGGINLSTTKPKVRSDLEMAADEIIRDRVARLKMNPSEVADLDKSSLLPEEKAYIKRMAGVR